VLILPDEIVAEFFNLDSNQQLGVYLAVLFLTVSVYLFVLPARAIIEWDKRILEYRKKRGYSIAVRVYSHETNPKIVKEYRTGAAILILVALLTATTTFWYELRALFSF
jgi:hypothetical protein